MVDPIIYKKVGEWEQKGHRKELLLKIENWLNQFDDEEKPEMLALLLHFDYYSQNKLPVAVQTLYQKFANICNSKDVVFAKIEKEKVTSFSSIFFSSFWYHNNLYDYTTDNLKGVIQQEKFPTSIVIVDDYFGTGNSMITYLGELLQLNPNLVNKNLYIITLQGSYIGKNNIEEYALKNNLNLTIISNKHSKKAFEQDNIYTGENAVFHRKKYANIYNKRNQNEKYRFGYEEIEALVSFYYNTPNNTLGLFWQNITNFRALFHRHNKKKTTLNQMQYKTKQHSELKNSKPFIRDVEDYKIDLFMVYCISKQKAFDVYEACVDFGLTEKQISEILMILMEKKYLIYENGKYSPTNELKQHLYTSRIKCFKSFYEQKPKDEKIKTTETSYIPKAFKQNFKGYKK